MNIRGYLCVAKYPGSRSLSLLRPSCQTPAAAAKSLQSCPTLCDHIDGSPPGSPVPRILQARTLGWVAISFSNAWKWKVKVKSFSCVRLLATPWTAAYQASLSMRFFRQEYWRGVSLPSLKNPLWVFKNNNTLTERHLSKRASYSDLDKVRRCKPF